LQFVQIIRRNGWRDTREEPLNRHFCAASGSADAAEMALLRRMARLMPPLCHLPLPLL